jgi:hypothetical protein
MAVGGFDWQVVWLSARRGERESAVHPRGRTIRPASQWQTGDVEMLSWEKSPKLLLIVAVKGGRVELVSAAPAACDGVRGWRRGNLRREPGECQC